MNDADNTEAHIFASVFAASLAALRKDTKTYYEGSEEHRRSIATKDAHAAVYAWRLRWGKEAK